ncbi:unnamed protein product [Calicophoron daubneyi]|uniref:Tyrosine-protein kinase n=1 Tax=Calicophoron daubneyi TaxID=300641 RepID=A0AAV2TVF3_CALDB
MGNSHNRRRKHSRVNDCERYVMIPSLLVVEDPSEDNYTLKREEADQRKQPAPSEQSEFARVRALFSFDGFYPDDLSFKKGDNMLVSAKNLDTWVYARHCTSGEGGFIPGNYVCFDDNEPLNVEGFLAVDRLEAEKKLFMPGLASGTYILRKQGDGVGFALSVRVNDASKNTVNVKHYRIMETTNGRYYIHQSHKYKTIAELIQWYTEVQGPLKCRLGSPFPHIYRPPVKFRDFEVPRSSIQLKRRLGEGEFGEVYVGVWNGQIKVAVKQHRHDSDRDEFITEARTMYELYHERIVSLLGVCTEPPEEPILIIMELMPRGSLLSYLKSEDGNRLGIKDQILLMLQISQGMKYLEEKRFVHRDLRAANVLVDRDGSVKVANFGLARFLQGTYEFVGNMETSEVIPQILDGYRLPNPIEGSWAGDNLYLLMRECWNTDPHSRPSFKSIYHIFCTWDFSDC